ncbi:MAG TPA: hypothetical protein VMZ52_01995 [Bryobacteraceae bacterium]|nr:hypothetical protein [Bryobacteraceae bacterium]
MFQNGKSTNRDVELPSELQAAFAAYRNALPDPDPEANFMPGLWSRIEAKQKVNHGIGLFARRLIAGAGVCCLILSGLIVTPLAQSPVTASYVDVLANEHVDEVAVEAEVSHHRENL